MSKSKQVIGPFESKEELAEELFDKYGYNEDIPSHVYDYMDIHRYVLDRIHSDNGKIVEDDDGVSVEFSL